jgi:hypothetical protein
MIIRGYYMRKVSEPRTNIWVYKKDVKRLRAFAELREETNAVIFSRILNALENNL